MLRQPDHRQSRRFRSGALAACALALALVSGCGGTADRLGARRDLKLGNENYLAGRYRQAIAHYDRAVTRVPTLARAYLNRAYSQEALFRASESLDRRRELADSAATSFLKYTELVEAGHSANGKAPGRERIDEHVLTLYLDSLQPGKASDLLAERLREHPDDMATLQMLANLAMEQGNLEDALRWDRRRIELAPDEPEGHVALAVLAWEYSHRDATPDSVRAPLLDEGIRAVERAVELKPDYFEALVYANLLYREKAKTAENDAERAEYEKKYTEYQQRAREVNEQQKKAGQDGSAGEQKGRDGGTATESG